MRTSIVLAGLIAIWLGAAIPSSISAQPMIGGDPKEIVEARVARLDSLLDLSDGQESAILQINLEMVEAMQELRRKAGGDRRAVSEELRDLRDEHDKQVLELLDDDQKETYREFRAKESEQMRERYRQRRNR